MIAFILMGMIALRLIQTVSFTGAGMAEALTALQLTLRELFDDFVYSPAYTYYRLHAKLFKKTRSPHPHSASYYALHSPLVQKLRNKTGLMAWICYRLPFRYFSVLYIHNSKGRAASEMS